MENYEKIDIVPISHVCVCGTAGKCIERCGDMMDSRRLQIQSLIKIVKFAER